MISLQSELITREEEKRMRHWNAADRWRVIQETIAWAESQQSVKRNTPAACLAKERHLLESLRRLARRPKEK